jgi:hypothetical protein
MNLIDKIKLDKEVIVTSKNDVTLTTGVYLRSGEDYKCIFYDSMDKYKNVRVILNEKNRYDSWYFFLENIDYFFFSKEIDREIKLKELGI